MKVKKRKKKFETVIKEQKRKLSEKYFIIKMTLK